MKQLSLMFLLVVSCSSFAMQTSPDEGDRNEEYDLNIKVTEPSPRSGQRKLTHQARFHLLTCEDPKENQKIQLFFQLVALTKRRASAPPDSTFAYYRAVQTNGNN